MPLKNEIKKFYLSAWTASNCIVSSLTLKSSWFLSNVNSVSVKKVSIFSDDIRVYLLIEFNGYEFGIFRSEV